MGDSGSELTFRQEQYTGSGGSSSGYGSGYGGGYDGSAYGGGPPPSVLDGSAFLPSFTETDRVLAWCRLVLAGVFISLGTFALVVMYRWRYVLDIRTRSVHLVLMSGASILASYLVPINESLLVLWGPDYSLDWFWSSLLLFFITPIVFVSYVCRALRLAVVFHPRAKRNMPWLIPERNHMWFLVAMAVGFLAIPIHHKYTLDVWEVIPEQVDILATVSVVFVASLACVSPFIRRVDDLFNISTELVVVTVLLVILTVAVKCVGIFGGREVESWIGRSITFVVTAMVFGVSVVDPLRRLARDPLAGTKRNGADRVLLARISGRSTARTASSSAHSDCEKPDGGGGGGGACKPSFTAGSSLEEGYLDGFSAVTPALAAAASVAALSSSSTLARPPGVDDLSPSPEPGAPEAGNWVYQGINFSSQPNGGDRGHGRGRRSRDTIESWNFERLARTPLLAAAFESFSRKALCHESVLFLSEVSRYESGDFSEPSGMEGPSQYEAFCRITDLFVRPGSREEVNISGADRKRILDWTHKGEAKFAMQAEYERRTIFGQAYLEVKSMLEDNLLRRFLQTDQFKTVRAQRQHVTSMTVSPPQGHL